MITPWDQHVSGVILVPSLVVSRQFLSSCHANQNTASVTSDVRIEMFDVLPIADIEL